MAPITPIELRKRNVQFLGMSLERGPREVSCEVTAVKTPHALSDGLFQQAAVHPRFGESGVARMASLPYNALVMMLADRRYVFGSALHRGLLQNRLLDTLLELWFICFARKLRLSSRLKSVWNPVRFPACGGLRFIETPHCERSV